MKKLSVILVLASLFISSAIYSQPESFKRKEKRKFSAEKTLFNMKHNLKLSEEQVSEIKSILFDTEKQLLEMREEEVELKMKFMEKHKLVMDKTFDKISGLLDDGQNEQFQNMKKEKEKERLMPPPPPKRHGKLPPQEKSEYN